MLVLAVDVETTGLDPEKDQIIEIGACVYSLDRKKPIIMLSSTIEISEPLTEEIIGITGISQEEVTSPIGQPLNSILFDLANLSKLDGVTHFMAHNAPFDRAFIQNAFKRSGIDMPELPWIDTITDVPYPGSITVRKLTYLAAEHGFLISHAHRAIFDVLAMCKIAGMYDHDEILKLASSPSVKVVGKQKFEDNHLVKACGFKWDGEAKKWFKIVKQCNLEKEKESYDFPYEIISDC